MWLVFVLLVPVAVGTSAQVVGWAMDPAGPLARYSDRVAERRAITAAPVDDFPALEPVE